MNLTTIRKILLSTFILSYSGTQYCLAEEPYDTEEQGKAEFIDNCSLCHGNNAKGDGVFAKLLTIDTPDLTRLKKDNGGVFPFKEVFFMIDGREEVAIHGPRYMPIWGDRFQSSTWSSVSDEHADTLVRGTIFELLLYLDSIQEN
ncbi:MAG: cytochrome c [Gammaproteobacteria bacterium]|nr:cytochrome c [Gammaproteobacteria bacterium]